MLAAVRLSRSFSHTVSLSRPTLRGLGGLSAVRRCGFSVSACVPSHHRDDTLAALSNGHPLNNVPDSVVDRVDVGLHRREGHPLNIIKRTIETYFASPVDQGGHGPPYWTAFDSLPPVVSTKQNFDDLLTPPDHVSRSPSDTFYVDDAHLLRCHTSAHQTQLLRAGHRSFLVTGDVYRRDTIDASHYPIFHQMEGVRIFSHDELPASTPRDAAVDFVMADLKGTLEGMVRQVFGDVECRWVDAYFPFTDPSAELEILFQDEWLEVLGCGMVHRDIMASTGLGDHHGYAFGLGLERLAMVLFGIPDIRLFWSDDARFLDQFASGKTTTKFKPYSKYPACYKDMAFWLPADGQFHEHDLFSLLRDVAGDLVEHVECIDTFEKAGRVSQCFRIMYRSMDRNLTNEEVDVLQRRVRELAEGVLGVELR